MHFPHGSNHSKGVLILVKKELYLHAKNVKIDNNGRFIFLNATIQNSSFVLANIYAPNENKEQVCFFNEITEILNNFDIEPDCNIFIGGDFNITFDTELDCSRRKPKVKDSVRVIKEIKRDFDLIDVWRIRNPEKKRFTWRQKNPLIQRRLDF